MDQQTSFRRTPMRTRQIPPPSQAGSFPTTVCISRTDFRPTRSVALSADPSTEHPNAYSDTSGNRGGHGPGKHVALHGTFRLSKNMLR